VTFQVAVVITLLIAVFAMEESQQFKFFYLLFLPLIWIAACHGLAGAIPAVALIQVGVIVSVLINGNAAVAVIEMQVLLLALALTGLLLGATVDEWRAASERLARAQQLTAASEMATALAHELNQPLTALSTYADAIRLLAASGRCKDDALIDAADRIQRVATRSVDIVARLRSVGNTCASKIERICVDEPLHIALARVQEQVARLNTSVTVVTRNDMPAFPIDRDRMAIVLQNLLTNALDAVEELPQAQRRVDISLGRDGTGHVLITVRDSGCGVSAELAEKVFEPFYSGKAKGMGLGLAISRSIVESHGGRLWLEPAAHGIFHVRLPV
jgi:C4-dicarboxylate-specific signal transduction histidine kinase